MDPWRKVRSVFQESYQRHLKEAELSQQAQSDQLRMILSSNQTSEFGLKHDFSTVSTISDYQAAVPISKYEDYQPYINRIAEGERNILFTEEATLFEETGGSTTGSKLIPYTPASLKAFQRGVFPWMADLLAHRPRIASGRMYWAISPTTRQKRKTPSGYLVGMDDDVAYFGQEAGPLIRDLLVVPTGISGIDPPDWKVQTLTSLIEADDLTFISVWSPTFLLSLLDVASQQREQILNNLRKLSPKRLNEVSLALKDTPIDTELLWPRLDTISCWTDGTSRMFVSKLKEIFPHTFIQGKGLLSTEGIVSFPMSECDAAVLAYQSGFYEFLSENGRIHLSHELNRGETYRVILTTYSGLYRYDLGDLVQVVGYWETLPLLRFVGRFGVTSDICGEKLTEEFVSRKVGQHCAFVMLAPSLGRTPHYRVFLEADGWNETTAQEMAADLDASLRENPQYDHARQIGQLSSLVPIRVPALLEQYLQFCQLKGKRLGEVKPPFLSTDHSIGDYLADVSTRSQGSTQG